ncbi:stability determinant [Sphingomonas sp.]|uniref:type II toxin-antitoxin system RelB family antitoxin n=1 Tax=Sphingomonas sp. TaxID=28214 RepID=UPI00307E5167
MGKLDPIYSEFETEEEAQAYDTWFRAQVQAALDSPEPDVPHDQVMAEIDSIIEKHRAAQARMGG